MVKAAHPDVLLVHGLTVTYGGVRALDDVSLGVAAGSIAGLIGSNGAGKTTLFGAISGTVPAVRGTIHFRGDDITGWPAHRRAAAGIGRTFQRLELFGNLTVLENLLVAREVRMSRTRIAHDLFGLPSGARAERLARDQAFAILEMVGLARDAATEAGALPLGAGRMLEIGRALCTDPSMLLLDEPSSGLDDAETETLKALIRRVNAERGTAIVVVEHDVAFVSALCEEITVLDAGQIIARGTPAEIRANAAVHAAYLGTEAS